MSEGSATVEVDYGICESNAVCMQVAPDLFEVRDDDMLHVLQGLVEGAAVERALEAARRCPRQAITVVSAG